METSEPLETNSSESTSSVEDTRASLSAKPESAEDRMTRGIFGPSSPVSFAYFDPDTRSWKTCQVTFLSGLEMFLETWPDSGTTRNGCASELRISEPPICESGFSSWPTATAHDDGKSPEAHLRMKQRMGERDGTHANRTAITSLAVKVQTWPTARREDGESAGNHPGATDSLTGATRNWATPRTITGGGESAERKQELGREESGGGDLQSQSEHWPTPNVPNGGRTSNTTSQREDGSKRQVDLAAIAPLWQTPATDSFRSRGGDRKDEMGLDQQARSLGWMTPNSRDWKSETGSENNTHDKTPNLSRQVYRLHPDQQTNDGPPSSGSAPTSRRRLNPRFVEWLMGFPPGWTEL